MGNKGGNPVGERKRKRSSNIGRAPNSQSPGGKSAGTLIVLQPHDIMGKMDRQNLDLTKRCDDMEWLYLLIAYLPVISIMMGIALLIVGLVLRKSQKQLSKGLLIVSGGCIALCLLVGIALFLAGALGIGPVPN